MAANVLATGQWNVSGIEERRRTHYSLMNHGRLLTHGFLRVEDRRHLLVLDLDEVKHLRGDFGSLSRHNGHRIAEKVDLVDGDDRLIPDDGTEVGILPTG